MPGDPREVATELAQLVPAAEVDEGPRDAVAGVLPTLHVRPTSVSELQQIVGWACDQDMAVAATGGGTKLGIGNPPSRLDLLIDMSALDEVVDYDREDLVLTAQAGITIQKVQSLVREDSLVLPMDPPSAHRATMGGVMVCADHGPRRRHYGGVRDLVLGLKVVFPDGSLGTFGGSTLKNVAGYDVGKLLVGSLGSVGIVAQITVRLLPAPACEDLLLAALPSLESGGRVAAGVLDSPLLPLSLALVSPECASLLDLGKQLSITAGSYLMLVALEGHPAAVERQARDISRICEEGGSATAARRASEIGVPPSEVWESSATLRDRMLARDAHAGFRCTVPLALVSELAFAVEGHAQATSVEASYTMDCGTGYLEAYAAGEGSALRTFAEGVRADAERRGGALTVLDGWSELGGEFDAWGTPRSDYGLMRAVKQKYDPKGIMNPGRFIGGL